MRNEKFIKWGYITGQEILFDDNVILKIISYDSKSQKIYFKYNNEISCCKSSYFIEFDSQRIENHFEIRNKNICKWYRTSIKKKQS